MHDYTPDHPLEAPDPSDREATVRYIGRMASELRGMAVQANLPFLAYLLGMAADDAAAQHLDD